jgi:cytochrome c biogenesis protein CcmG/thiol:disulfide interchange protein DsbE
MTAQPRPPSTLGLMTRWFLALALALVTAACSPTNTTEGVAATDLAPIDVAGFEELIARSDRPMVVNFWASWCIPCRSEAPLLAAAHAADGDVRFLGIASDDTQAGAAGFIEEFEIGFENYFDASGDVKGSLGGVGLPMTVFVAPGGEIVLRHFGVIDDQALALGIDELLRR